MLFGVKLASDMYLPWKESYINYDGLKELLNENEERDTAHNSHSKDKGVWTDDDENKFVEALDKELEKVYSFQLQTYNSLMNRLTQLEKQTDTIEKIKVLNSDTFRQVLEVCLTEAQELDNFSRLNFTGFVKIVKKHDKLHPKYPSVKALLQVRLKELPFHSEEYSPLLYRISFLYNILRGNFDTTSKSLASTSKLSNVGSVDESQMEFQTFKFWVHEDNLMEVKTRILRHLPVLVYAPAPSENDNIIDEFENDIIVREDDSYSSYSSGSNNERKPNLTSKSFDPTITVVYFDNDYFELYNNKLLKNSSAPTLRLRWIGKLINKPDIFLEKRVSIEREDGKKDFDITKLKMKSKYLNGFIFNNDIKYKENFLKRLKDNGAIDDELNKLSSEIDEIQRFIMQEELQPVLRTVYHRTAFQIPGDDRIRITIDSDIAFIREDAFDKQRPIRDPKSWHRTDIDSDVANPMKLLRKGEYAKFPFSVMEVKIKNSNNQAWNGSGSSFANIKLPTKHGQWIADLTNSHLVKEVPNFSLFIQGLASLFGDYERLDILPFWLPDLENDIRRNPSEAYEEEKKKIQKQKEIQAKLDGMRKLSKIQNVLPSENSFESEANRLHLSDTDEADLEDHESSDEENTTSLKERRHKRHRQEPTFLKILTGGGAKLVGVDSEDEEIGLPEGVKKPTNYIKNAGPIKVEAKVWLANERTFNRWLSVTSLLSVLTFSIYNSVKQAAFPNLATYLAYVYFGLTIFCALWSYRTYLKRLSVIRARSGQHLDAPLGPMIVAVVLAVTLIINFIVAFRTAAQKQGSINMLDTQLSDNELPGRLKPIEQAIFRWVGVSN
ncbi:vacuolar transporter chaperone complex subunit 2 [Monosporozyma servazzii]